MPLHKALDWLCLLLFWVIPTTLVGAAGALRQDPLPSILENWDRRRNHLNCLEWHFAGTRIGSRERDKGAATPSKTVEGKLDITARFNFQENRFYRKAAVDSYFGSTDGVDQNSTITVAFGGAIRSRILPGSVDLKTSGVDFVVHKGEPREMPTGDVDLYYWRPIFWASGIVPTKNQPVTAVLFPSSNTASAFVFKGFEAIDGRELALFSVDSFHFSSSLTKVTNYVRYWIDMERDSAIVRAVAESGVPGVQTTGYQIDVDYRPQLKTWLPSRWVVRETLNGKTTVTEMLKVVQVDAIADDSPSHYALEPEPEMRVYETDTRRDPISSEIIVGRRAYIALATGQSNLLRATVDRYETRAQDQRRDIVQPSRK